MSDENTQDTYDPKRHRRLPIHRYGNAHKRNVTDLNELGDALQCQPTPPYPTGSDAFCDFLEEQGILSDWTVLLDAAEAFSRSMWLIYARHEEAEAVKALREKATEVAKIEAWDPEPQA